MKHPTDFSAHIAGKAARARKRNKNLKMKRRHRDTTTLVSVHPFRDRKLPGDMVGVDQLTD